MPPYNPGPLFRRGSRTFGRQRHPITGKVTGHAGDDWPAPSGTPIPAAYGGRVVENRHQYNAATGTGWGWMVLLEHQVNGQTVQTRYAHMRQQSPLGLGEPVFKGQTIGEVGSTGGSTGPHLHFEVIVNGEPVDPATFDFPDEVTETATGNWSYPFPVSDSNGDTPVSEAYQQALAEAESGYFPVGINGVWHGGIHFDRGTGARLEQEDGVHSITSGEVIAYRVDSTYPVSEYSTGEAEYSRGFALVRHRLTLPRPPESGSTSEPPDVDRATTDDDSTGNPPRPRPRPVDVGASDETGAVDEQTSGKKEGNQPDGETLTFFSLYMHLAQAGDYSDEEKTRPGYWESYDNRYRVADKAVDANPYDPADRRKGIRVRQGRGSSTSCIGWLPPGVTLTVDAGSGNWRKIVAYNEGGPAVDPEHGPSQDAPLGWIYIGELNKVDVRDPAATDAVHVLETPVPVQAGEFLGYIGQYRRRRDAGPFCTPRPMLHLEVFAGDEFESFIAKSRERAAELPEASRTLLYVKKDARLALPTEPDRLILPAEAIVADESGSDAGEWVSASIGVVQTLPRSALGTYSGDATRSYGGVHHLLRILDTNGNAIALDDYNALGRTAQADYPNREVVSATDIKVWIRRSDLGEGRVIHGHTLPAWSAFPLDPAANNGPTSAFPRVIPVASLPTPVTDGDGKRWWQVEVGMEGGDSATGWARESGQPNVELCSPWAWPGFDITREQVTRADMHQHSLHVNRETHASENFKIVADQVDGSQLFKKLREALDVDGSNGISRTEMRKGLRRPWLAQAISHLIVRYESEWGGGMSKWAELDPQMEGELAADWEAEKARIEDLQWWDDVAGAAALPGSPELYFIHPIALISNFMDEKGCANSGKCALVTAEMLKKIFPRAPHQRLKIVADGVNMNIEDGKLDSEERLTHFFGQVRQEIGTNMAFREDLRYSADGLFNSDFSYYRGNRDRSNRDAGNEEAIANNAYADANRGEGYKLGNTQAGDGWRYRGRGLKQLTGRANYRNFTAAHERIWGERVDFEAQPDKVDEPTYAVRSALAFWVENRLYEHADAGVTQEAADNITRAINSRTRSYAARWGFVQDIWRDRIFKDVCFNAACPLRRSQASLPSESR